jgi:hypothetical protein
MPEKRDQTLCFWGFFHYSAREWFLLDMPDNTGRCCRVSSVFYPLPDSSCRYLEVSMEPIPIQSELFCRTLERAADVALTEYRVHRSEIAFQKSLGQLDGIFLGVFVTLKGMGPSSEASGYMSTARQISLRYRQELSRLRELDLRGRAV